MTAHLFCTYCDQGYAARLLCLHESLVVQGEPFVLHVLCFDRETETVLRAASAPTLVVVPLDEVLRADPSYAVAHANRTRVEFYFTSTPIIVRHCLARAPEAEVMTYVDADLFFFGPVSAVFAEQSDASVGIVPHRFPPHLQERERYGRYNVAWVSFRRDASGLACLEWWRERCLEWCHDRVEDGRFADQGYLDEFPCRFTGVKVLDHPGINAAPWNMGGVQIARDDGQVQVDGRGLLFYHFQGIREPAPGWFEPGLRQYRTALTPSLRELVYRPYLERLLRWQHRLQQAHGIGPQAAQQRLNTGTSLRDRWERFKTRWVLPYYGRLTGRLIYCPEASP